MSTHLLIGRRSSNTMRLITLASLLGGDLGCRACKSGPHEAEHAADAAAANPWAPKAAPVVDDNFGADLGSSVHGQVLSASGSPLEGLNVAIGDRTAVTDRNGAFVFEEARPEYDVAIVACDRSGVTVFSGLTRRNPTLLFEKECQPKPEAWNYAQLSGSLSGDLKFPLPKGGRVQMYLLSDDLFAHFQLGGTVGQKGPDYGPWQLGWVGPKTLKARLVAVGGTLSRGGWESVFLGTAEVLLSADAEVTAHLSLATSANEKLSGMANFSDPKASPSIVIDYRWPFQNGIATLLSDLPSPAEAARFSYGIPPMSGLGGQFCVSVFAGRSGTRLCGMPTGTPPIIFEMPTTPSLLTPMDLAQAEAATEFSWTAFTGGIHRLRFEPVSNPDIPVVDVYTSRTTATWPDLKGLGIPFPAGHDLHCKLTGFSPFPSVDVAAGPYGLTHLNTERREADAEYIRVHAVQKAAIPPTGSP